MKTLLDAVQAAGVGSPIQLESPKSEHTVEIVLSGSIASATVDLEGSLSGEFWQALASCAATSSNLSAGGVIFHVAEKIIERVRANLTVFNSGHCSRGTLSIGGALASGNTITIGSTTYKFGTTLATADKSILINATAASCIQNLSLALILGAGSGVKYTSAASHPSTTLATLAAGSMVIRARTKGVAGDSIVTTATGATLTWGHGHLQSGVDIGSVTVHYSPHPNR